MPARKSCLKNGGRYIKNSYNYTDLTVVYFLNKFCFQKALLINFIFEIHSQQLTEKIVLLSAAEDKENETM